MMASTSLRRALPVACTTLLLGGLAACGGNSRDGDDARDSASMGTADSAGAMSGGTTAEGASAMANSTLNDTSVLYLIASVDRGEAAAGRIASTKATQSDVKSYARMMVREHAADLTKLQRLATTASITLDTSDMQSDRRIGSTEGAAGGSSSGGTNSSGSGTTGGTSESQGLGSASSNGAVMQLQQNMQQVMGRLQTATGADFDRQYIASQLAGHQQVLDLLRENESRLQNAAIRSHVTAMTAAVEKHLERARQIQQKIGGDSATTAR